MAFLAGARNIQDASLEPVTFTLPSAASLTVTSAAVDLGSETRKPGSFELGLSIPALTSTMAPSTAAGVTYIVETSTTSTFAAIARQILDVGPVTAVATAGIPTAEYRCRVPSDCERYVRGKITYGATMADSSTLAGTFAVYF